MNKVYDYLLEEKNKGVEAPSHVIYTLLFALAQLEQTAQKHPDYHELDPLMDDLIFHYTQANNWIPYRKRKIATQTDQSLHAIKKEIQQLVQEGKVIVRTLPNDTFLEIIN